MTKKLTKDQKTTAEILCAYERRAAIEYHKNGLSEKHDETMWLVVRWRDELGMDVCEHKREAHDRHNAIIKAGDVDRHV